MLYFINLPISLSDCLYFVFLFSNYFLLITKRLQNNKAIAIFDLKFNYFIVNKALAKSTLNFLNNFTRQKPPPEVFSKKGVLICSAKFTGTHLCQSLSPVSETCSFIKHRCFPVNFAKLLRTPF